MKITNHIYIRIKENAFVARLAALKLGTKRAAIVFGSTIYLYGASRKDIQDNVAWMRHEVMHVLQYHREGVIRFLIKYLWLSLRFGYRNNPLEKEARNAENDKEILNKVHFL